MIKRYLTKLIALGIFTVIAIGSNSIGASAEWKNRYSKTDDYYDYYWQYFNGSSYVTGWQQIDNKWYYFDDLGYMKHDTFIDGYYLNSNGELTDVITSGNFKFDKSTGTIVKCTDEGESIEIPSVIDGVKVSTIGCHSFEGLSNVTNITIPNSITCIKYYAFGSCENLKSINLPDNLTEIGDSTFYKCRSLSNILIPSNVSKIGAFAFYGCTSLSSITIPDGIKAIEMSTFNYCTSLTSVKIPESVTSIAPDAFRYDQKLSSILIPRSVTSIGAAAFWGCDNTIFYAESEDVNQLLLNGNAVVTEKKGNIKLSTQQMQSGWKHDSAGWWYADNNSWYTGWRLIDGKWYYFDSKGYMAHDTTIDGYQLASDGSIIVTTSLGPSDFLFDANTGTITKYNGAKTDVVIPSSINGVNVISIGQSAFWNCSNLTSITIPNGVTSIGDVAFWQCSNLKSLSIPNSVTSIGRDSFYGCSSLTSVNILDGLKSIGGGAFSECNNLTSIVIPSSVTTIGDYAFSSISSTANKVQFMKSSEKAIFYVDSEKAKQLLINYGIDSSKIIMKS